MGKIKVVALSFVLIALGLYFWSQRIVDLKIAGVLFRVPNPAIVSASAMRRSSGDLDSTQGAFLELPNGPYFGKWGIQLQSSRERKAKGFPSPFDGMVDAQRATDALKSTNFGWYQCTESCGRGTWYFKSVPVPGDSVYSVNSIICHETEICELLFTYRDVDVIVSLQRSKIEDAPKVMEQAVAILSSFVVPVK